jgi:predicted transcriptional regulator
MVEFNLKEERAAKAIQELQDKLREALDERKEIEIEFVALKKNYLNLQEDLERERSKNDNMGLEFVNLVNENKALQSTTDKGKMSTNE